MVCEQRPASKQAGHAFPKKSPREALRDREAEVRSADVVVLDVGRRAQTVRLPRGLPRLLPHRWELTK